MTIKHDSEGPRHVHECTDCKPQHTPTPWKVEGPFLERSIFGEKDLVTRLVGTDPTQASNAAYIVRAVNAHEELVETLKGVKAWLESKAIVERHPEAVAGFNHWTHEIGNLIIKVEGR